MAVSPPRSWRRAETEGETSGLTAGRVDRKSIAEMQLTKELIGKPINGKPKKNQLHTRMQTTNTMQQIYRREQKHKRLGNPKERTPLEVTKLSRQNQGIWEKLYFKIQPTETDGTRLL